MNSFRSWAEDGALLVLMLLAQPSLHALGNENWDSAFGLPGANGIIRAVATSDKHLYVGGRFSSIGGVSATNVAKWDGVNWSALASGIGGFDPNNGAANDVYTMAIFKSELYVGGSFTNAGTVLATNIAKWDGTNWSTVGGGLYGVSSPIWVTTFPVYSLASGAEALYAGGRFTIAGGMPVNKVAKWDGAKWSSVGEGVSYVNLNPNSSPFVTSIAVASKDVYVGGCFNKAGASASTNIARWNGTNWTSLGCGLGSSFAYNGVYSVATDGNNVYAGGVFRTSGSSTVKGIAKWEGAGWSELGGGLTGSQFAGANVSSILISGGRVFIGGSQFYQAGGVDATNIAAWDGTAWSPLGSGISGLMATAGFNDSGVYALAAYDGDLLVVGGFDTAGINSATNIALWHIPQQLLIQYSNYGLTLSWPASGSNFVLEACRDWANPIWTPLTEEPAVIDGQCIITSTISGKNRFFRLHKH